MRGPGAMRGALAPWLLLCRAAAEHRDQSTEPTAHPRCRSPGAETPHTALPALPDGVGDAPHADAVGEPPHSLPRACVPDGAVLLQRGRPCARHPGVPGLRSLPTSLRLPGGCLALPLPPPPFLPGTAQGPLPMSRVRAGRCPRHLLPQRKQRRSFFFQRRTDQ